MPQVMDSLTSSTSSLPGPFILLLLVAIFGIPLYLISTNAFKPQDLALQIKSSEVQSAAEQSEAKKKGKDGENYTPDDPAPPLDFGEVKNVGALMGAAALVALAATMYPEELSGLLKMATGGAEVEKFDWTNPLAMWGHGVIKPKPGLHQSGGRAGSRSPRVVSSQSHGKFDSKRNDRYVKVAFETQKVGLPGQESYLDLDPRLREMLLLCKVSPELCDRDLLSRLLANRDRDRETMSFSVNSARGSVTHPQVIRSTLKERHMTAVRAQPVLLIPFSDYHDPNAWFKVYAALLIFPGIYVFAQTVWGAMEVRRHEIQLDKFEEKKEKDLAEAKKFEKQAELYAKSAERIDREKWEMEKEVAPMPWWWDGQLKTWKEAQKEWRERKEKKREEWHKMLVDRTRAQGELAKKRAKRLKTKWNDGAEEGKKNRYEGLDPFTYIDEKRSRPVLMDESRSLDEYATDFAKLERDTEDGMSRRHLKAGARDSKKKLRVLKARGLRGDLVNDEQEEDKDLIKEHNARVSLGLGHTVRPQEIQNREIQDYQEEDEFNSRRAYLIKHMKEMGQAVPADRPDSMITTGTAVGAYAVKPSRAAAPRAKTSGGGFWGKADRVLKNMF